VLQKLATQKSIFTGQRVSYEYSGPRGTDLTA